MMTWKPSTIIQPSVRTSYPNPASLPPRLAPIPAKRIALTLSLFDAGVLATAFQLPRIYHFPTPVWLLDPLPLGLAFVCCILAMASSGLYDPRRAAEGTAQALRLTRAWLLLAGAGFVGAYLNRSGEGAVLGIALNGWLLSILVRPGLVRPWLKRAFAERLRGVRVIVGTGALARRLAFASERVWSPVLAGFVDDPGPFSERVDTRTLPAPYLGGIETVEQLAKEGRITQVLVAREDLSRGRLVELAHQWLGHNLQVSLVSSAFEVMVARASASLLGGLPLANLQPSLQRGWRLKSKRCFDIAFAFLGGLVLLPMLALVAAAIKLTSPGPILYQQKRIGWHGKEFTLYKFRSMVANNDDRVHRKYMEALIRGGEPAGFGQGGQKVYKLVNDPRITPVGRLLRATSLDEFPQLLNVIRGDMSLVGPRPCLSYEWDLYEDWQRSRLDVLPGITGLWQVSGRSRVPFEEMVLLDLHYIANWSWSLDLALLLRTVPVVLNGSGGH
jgi:exopolysaccharide biosynthesis polyprenyl glycosylphosphotransferase